MVYNCQLLLHVPTKKALRLTKIDSDVYDKFRAEFAEMAIDKLNVEFIKSTQAKEVSYLRHLYNRSVIIISFVQ